MRVLHLFYIQSKNAIPETHRRSERTYASPIVSHDALLEET